MMDRIDIQIDVPAVPSRNWPTGAGAESSETIRARVVEARNKQLRRFYDDYIYTNAQIGPRHLRKFCVLTADSEKLSLQVVFALQFPSAIRALMVGRV